jgi:hypothetical protein
MTISIKSHDSKKYYRLILQNTEGVLLLPIIWFWGFEKQLKIQFD